MFNLFSSIRPQIKQLLQSQPQYEEPNTSIHTRLHTNENPFGSPLLTWYNRSPNQHQERLKKAIATIKNISPDAISLSNGMTNLIDLFLLCFCNSKEHNVIVCPPTDAIFETRAQLHGIEVRKAPLLQDFQLNLSHLETLADSNTKIIWLCSPNNPTGNSIYKDAIENILNNFNGLVIIDESYINFSRQKSLLSYLPDYPNLVVLQSLDIAWGLAGLQVSMAFSSTEFAAIMGAVSPSFINTPTVEMCIKAFEETGQVNDMILELVNMRKALAEVFVKIPFVEKVYTSDANFIFVKMKNANEIYQYLLRKGIQVANFSDYPFCENCIRITVGTEQENAILVDALYDYFQEIYSHKT